MATTMMGLVIIGANVYAVHASNTKILIPEEKLDGENLVVSFCEFLEVPN